MGKFKHVELISLPNGEGNVRKPISKFKIGTHFIAEEVIIFGVKYYSVILQDHIGNLPVEHFKLI